MSGMAQGMVSNILNATLPTHASSAGFPSIWTAYAASQMKMRLNSAASTASAAGTELSGTGYASGGSAITQSSTPSSAGSSVTLPAMSAGLSWTNGSGGAWSIASMDLTDGSGSRGWFGSFNGQPISVANGNTFQVAQNACTFALS